jgi:hypothetical protein
MADYSINPQFANLSGLQPLQALDLTRGGSLQFQPLDQIEIVSSRPELVAQGIAGAVQGIAQGALTGITARWEKEEERAKETRKYAQELALEEAKQKTKNQYFIDELKLKTAAEHGTEADLPERLDQIDKAAERLGFVNPSGNVAEKKPAKKQTPAQPLPPPVEVPLPVIDPSQQDITAANQPPPVVAVPPIGMPVVETPPVVTPQPEVATPSPASTALGELDIPDPDVTRAKQPAPALAQVAIPTQTPAPTVVSGLPEQPSDPQVARNTAGIEFMPSESANAYDAAARLSTPYWKLVPEQNPSTKKWSLRQEDTSEAVNKLGIDRANLVLAQNKQAIEREKADRERLDAETKKLKDDKQYLQSQKTKLDDSLGNVGIIDQAISLINANPEAVGIITKIYKENKKLPVLGDIGGWTELLAFYGYQPSKDRLQNIENVSEALESVKSNIGFEKLGELKSLSPTGASGLGSLTEGERNALQKTKGSIEQAQSAEILLSRLYDLRSGVIKSSGNAFLKIREVEPKYVPIQTMSVLEMNPSEINELNSLRQILKSSTDKESAEYKNQLKRFTSLAEKSKRIDSFNNSVFESQ